MPILSIRRGRALAALALLPILPAALHAQGALSTQGFGFAPGQLSTRGLTMGGASGESDPLSPLNPSTVGASNASLLYFQYDPEFRRVTIGDRKGRSTTARFSEAAAIFRANERWTFGATASTLLDRSWEASNDTTRMVGGAPLTSRETFRSLGAITDLRFATSYVVGPNVRVGLGLHAITGSNRLLVQGQFGDSSTLVLQENSVNYGGWAASGGVDVRLSNALGIAASARHGGGLRMRERDGATIASARVPDRAGAELRFTGLTGTTISGRLDWTGWSAMKALSTERVTTYDTWDAGVGADITGPRIGRRIVMLRTGARWRELPFATMTGQVKELSLGGGLGLPLASNRAMFDMGLVHASRSGGGDPRERAWTLSAGLTVRP